MITNLDPVLMASLLREASQRKLTEAAPGSAEAAIKRRVASCLAGIAFDIEREAGIGPASSVLAVSGAAMPSAVALSGDACGTCGNFTLIRTGTCMTCQSCGSTSGCA